MNDHSHRRGRGRAGRAVTRPKIDPNPRQRHARAAAVLRSRKIVLNTRRGDAAGAVPRPKVVPRKRARLKGRANRKRPSRKESGNRYDIPFAMSAVLTRFG